MTLKGSVFSYGFALLRFVFKRFVEIQELLGAEFFGADGRGPIQKFNRRLDFLLVVITSEGICERLSLLRECGTDKVEESVGRLDGVFARCQKHRGAIDVWLWRKMFRSDLTQNLRVRKSRNEHGKAPVIAGAGFGANAFGDFELHHPHKAFGQVQARHKSCDNCCTYVVWQVAGDPRLFVRIQECLQVEFQKVDVDNVEVLVVLEFLFQDFDALLVNFDGGDF